jgi:hypothetical protein
MEVAASTGEIPLQHEAFLYLRRVEEPPACRDVVRLGMHRVAQLKDQ